jgi:hypothetical protein
MTGGVMRMKAMQEWGAVMVMVMVMASAALL